MSDSLQAVTSLVQQLNLDQLSLLADSSVIVALFTNTKMKPCFHVWKVLYLGFWFGFRFDEHCLTVLQSKDILHSVNSPSLAIGTVKARFTHSKILVSEHK